MARARGPSGSRGSARGLWTSWPQVLSQSPARVSPSVQRSIGPCLPVLDTTVQRWGQSLGSFPDQGSWEPAEREPRLRPGLFQPQGCRWSPAAQWPCPALPSSPDACPSALASTRRALCAPSSVPSPPWTRAACGGSQHPPGHAASLVAT